MTDLVSARRPSVRGAGSSVDPKTALAVAAFVGVVLWVGREILVPIAIAVLLSFVLAPLVRLLRRVGVGRTISVFVVVAVAFLVIFGIGAVFTRQMTQLAGDLPRYEATVTQKIEAARGAAARFGLIAKLSELVRNFGEQLNLQPVSASPAPAPNASTAPAQAPIPVVVQQPPPAPIEIVKTIALNAFGPLATAGIVFIFVIFILLQREDLRDRMIRLAGQRDLQRTTAAIDDAARRLSRYFLAQTTVNATFGLVIGTGLWLIGVPSAPLWGIMAMILRFVPYVGPVAAAVLPLVLSVAVAPGWTKTLETAALFFVVEPIVGQFLEPIFYGHSTGLSPIAVIVAATIWTWLWGPVGLILSTPLTVCLVVLGRHVDQLEFLDVLLGDAPPLTPEETFYQRALAGHPLEAVEQAERFLKTGTLSDYFNQVALPALHLAQSDVRRGALDEARQLKLFDTIEDLADALSDRPESAHERDAEDRAEDLRRGEDPPGSLEPLPEDWKTGRAVLCVPGRSALDRSAGVMLAALLSAQGIAAEVEEGELLAARRVNRLDLAGVRLVCLSYLDSHLNPAHVRFVIRRLRRRAPNVTIVGGFWTPPQSAAEVKTACEESGADSCAFDLAEAVDLCLKAARSSVPESQERSAPSAVA